MTEVGVNIPDAEDRILERLPEYAKPRYRELVPAGVRMEYAESLSKVPRWRGNTGVQIVDPGFHENDLEHVQGLLDWMNEIELMYPLLWREVCGGNREVWMELMAMLIIHDSGEIKVGDLLRADPEFNSAKGKRHKKKEARMARLMIRNSLPEQSDLLIGYYERFDRRLTDDLPVMLGHILDKAQAAQNVALHVLPFSVKKTDFDLGKHYFIANSAFLEYAEHLSVHISGGARRELLDFLHRNVLSKFENLEGMDVKELQLVVRAKFDRVFEGMNVVEE